MKFNWNYIFFISILLNYFLFLQYLNYYSRFKLYYEFIFLFIYAFIYVFIFLFNLIDLLFSQLPHQHYHLFFTMHLCFIIYYQIPSLLVLLTDSNTFLQEKCYCFVAKIIHLLILLYLILNYSDYIYIHLLLCWFVDTLNNNNPQKRAISC